MIHVWKVIVLIIFVLAAILLVREAINTVQSIASLETRIFALAGLLFGLVFIAWLLLRISSRLERTTDIESQVRKTWLHRFGREIYFDPTSRFTVIVTLVVSVIMLLSDSYPDLMAWASHHGFGFISSSTQFITASDRQFFINFIEWFGVFYGFVISGILIKVWEQFDGTDRLFDKEADAVSILHGTLLLVGVHHQNFKIRSFRLLYEYVAHVIHNYDAEYFSRRDQGNKILQTIRQNYLPVIRSAGRNPQLEILFSELNGQLNNIINLRGDRIAASAQRIFASFRLLCLLISVMWLLPFYFLPDEAFGAIHQALIVGVTFLVIFILSVIEDLDDPFGGIWRVSLLSWENLLSDLNLSLEENEQQMNNDKTTYETKNKLADAQVDLGGFDMSRLSSSQRKEHLVEANLQAEVDINTSEIHESAPTVRDEYPSRASTKNSIVGSILVSISIIVAAVILRKRK